MPDTPDLITQVVQRANTFTGGQRRGQALSNALYEVRPDIWESLIDTDADPFYDDAKIGRFFEVLAISSPVV